MLAGYKTLIFGLVTIIAPHALDYLAGIDWTTLGLSKSAAGVIGAAIIGLRFWTKGPVFGK